MARWRLTPFSGPVRFVRVPFLIPFWAVAQTWGRFILVKRGHTLTPAQRQHEMTHVAQWRKYKWRFPFLYLWENIRHGRYRNRFEIEAWQHE